MCPTFFIRMCCYIVQLKQINLIFYCIYNYWSKPINLIHTEFPFIIILHLTINKVKPLTSLVIFQLKKGNLNIFKNSRPIHLKSNCKRYQINKRTQHQYDIKIIFFFPYLSLIFLSVWQLMELLKRRSEYLWTCPECIDDNSH